MTDAPFDVVGPAAADVVKVMNRYRYAQTLGGRDSKKLREMIRYVILRAKEDKQNRSQVPSRWIGTPWTLFKPNIEMEIYHYVKDDCKKRRSRTGGKAPRRDASSTHKLARILLDDMTQTLEQSGGVGLAAPEIGICRRVVVLFRTGTRT